MKKVIIDVDDSGYILDKSGVSTAVLLPQAYEFVIAPAGEKHGQHAVTNIAQLVTLGVTPDELLKLKASGII